MHADLHSHPLMTYTWRFPLRASPHRTHAWRVIHDAMRSKISNYETNTCISWTNQHLEHGNRIIDRIHRVSQSTIHLVVRAIHENKLGPSLSKKPSPCFQRSLDSSYMNITFNRWSKGSRPTAEVVVVERGAWGGFSLSALINCLN
jgi:hypothetical protein